ncbi:GAF and ANTAR domain-containing protein [Nocardioides pyridinolyticus]
MPADRRALAERMAEAARQLQDEATTQTTMEVAVRLAVENVRGCDFAAFSIVRRGRRLETPAYTSETALAGDLLQYELGEGPCVDAAWEERLVHSGDLSSDRRWPTWAPRVVRDHGVHSILCLQLFTHSDSLGALNLYSTTPDAYARDDLDDGLALAAHVAIAMAASLNRADLNAAIDSRTVIGQATGMLMERYRLDQTTAFALLSRASSNTNTKVRDLARELVETGHIAAIERTVGVQSHVRPTRGR